VRQRRFIYLRTAYIEGNPKTAQQFLSINGTGTKDKSLIDLLCFQSLAELIFDTHRQKLYDARRESRLLDFNAKCRFYQSGM
jgi:hypothetical protein